MPLSKRLPNDQALIRVIQVEAPTLTPEEVPQLLREINDRQWAAVLEVLFEAKYKAESQLRNDAIYESLGRTAHFQGWLTYSDYIIGSLETLRATQSLEPAPEPEPGPE